VLDLKVKVNYRGKMNAIKIYLITRDDRNTLLEGNSDIVVPLTHEVIKSLFGWLSKSTDLLSDHILCYTVNLRVTVRTLEPV